MQPGFLAKVVADNRGTTLPLSQSAKQASHRSLLCRFRQGARVPGQVGWQGTCAQRMGGGAHSDEDCQAQVCQLQEEI